jgi:hypothetical protein
MPIENPTDKANTDAEKNIAETGENDFAVIDARRLDRHQQLERERIHLLPQIVSQRYCWRERNIRRISITSLPT